MVVPNTALSSLCPWVLPKLFDTRWSFGVEDFLGVTYPWHLGKFLSFAQLSTEPAFGHSCESNSQDAWGFVLSQPVNLQLKMALM